jgi:hypothetical protein
MFEIPAMIAFGIRPAGDHEDMIATFYANGDQENAGQDIYKESWHVFIIL